MKKVLILNGHPHRESLCHALAQAFAAGLTSEASVETLHLTDLKFDPIMRFGFQKEQPLEPDLVQAQDQIKNADHLVFIYPNWWGSPPALLKGFLDRILLPGFAFKYNSRAFPDQLLKGKTSELIVTMDTPVWFYKYFLGAPGIKVMTKSVLGFCGVKNKRVTYFAPVRGTSLDQRQHFLQKASQLGIQAG